MAGAIYSYGNARTSPYNEQFYIGGANSIRAFTIRSIGPGRYYQNSDNNKYAYIDRTGDLKFEANLEYRFPILGDLHGATFLDSGNIWLIRNDPDRPGGQLKWGSFLKDLALGTRLRPALRPHLYRHPFRRGYRSASPLRYRKERLLQYPEIQGRHGLPLRYRIPLLAVPFLGFCGLIQGISFSIGQP